MSHIPTTKALKPFLTDDKPINLDQDTDIQSGRLSTCQQESPLSAPAETNCEYPMHCDWDLHERMLEDLKKWVD